eukprot:TRINITY_DN23502_c0_g1_i1.p1 TRINITY_DN23502_c0_g1~~TRINITY_DN23502_c0_g1_i1.p1  ORF type:complete len:314 (+),score=22.51 TRINITY_DN23502_c0_g1_i1:85-1026(+)
MDRDAVGLLGSATFWSLGTLRLVETHWSLARNPIPSSFRITKVWKAYTYFTKVSNESIFPIGLIYGLIAGTIYIAPPLLAFPIAAGESFHTHESYYDPIDPITRKGLVTGNKRVFLAFTSIGAILALPFTKYHTYLLVAAQAHNRQPLGFWEFTQKEAGKGISGLVRGLGPVLCSSIADELLQLLFYTHVHLGHMFVQKLEEKGIKKTNFTHSLGVVIDDILYSFLRVTVQVPFRTLLARMISNPVKYHNVVSTLLTILTEEGIGGLYRGFSPALFSQMLPTVLISTLGNVIFNIMYGVPTRTAAYNDDEDDY